MIKVLLTVMLAATTIPQTHNWVVTPTAVKGVTHLINRVSEGALHAVCKNTECKVYVEPRLGCRPGARYPMLVNSTTMMGVLAGRCVIMKDRMLVAVSNPHSFTQLMFEQHDVSIAFPTQAGPINVLDIKMQGFTDALKVEAPSRYRT